MISDDSFLQKSLYRFFVNYFENKWLKEIKLRLGNATNPILFEPFVLSIILGQQERIRKLERELQAIKPGISTHSTGQEPKEVDPVEPKITIPPVTSGGEQARLN